MTPLLAAGQDYVCIYERVVPGVAGLELPVVAHDELAMDVGGKLV